MRYVIVLLVVLAAVAAFAGATILSLKGWRFSGTDSITGTVSWKLAVRETSAVSGTGPFEENGIIVTTSAATGPVTFDVKTTQGNFTFSSQDVPFGVSKTMAQSQSGGDVYLAYTQFVHGNRTLAQTQSTKQVITDFAFLSRPTTTIAVQ